MRCLFRLFRTPQAWLALEGNVLMRWGLFNPNGPTLYCIGLRPTGARGEIEVFYRWMHFLGGEDYCLGYITDRHGRWMQQLSEILLDTSSMPRDRDHLSPEVWLFNNIPSFFSTLVPDDLVPAIHLALAKSPAIRTTNWARERYLLQKYGADLFGRAGEEVRETLERLKTDASHDSPSGREALGFAFAKHQHIPTFRDWVKRDIEARELADGDIEAWWETVQDINFRAAAHFAFAQAWMGASEHSGHDLAVVTPFTDVLEFLRHFNHPWPDVSTDDRGR